MASKELVYEILIAAKWFTEKLQGDPSAKSGAKSAGKRQKELERRKNNDCSFKLHGKKDVWNGNHSNFRNATCSGIHAPRATGMQS